MYQHQQRDGGRFSYLIVSFNFNSFTWLCEFERKERSVYNYNQLYMIQTVKNIAHKIWFQTPASFCGSFSTCGLLLIKNL